MSASDKILDSLRLEMAAPEFRRLDVTLADYHMISASAAVALFEYDPDLGPPKVSDLVQNCNRNFNSRVCAHVETARLYEDAAAVKVVLSVAADRRPAADSEEMLCLVQGSRFLDSDMGSTWKMLKEQDGTPILERLTDDNISEILAARKQRLGTARASFGASIQPHVPYTNAGDKVRFFNDRQYSSGTVVRSGVDGVDIQPESGPQVRVTPSAVLEYIKASEASESSVKADLRKYYSQIYPKEYVDDLLTKVLL